MNKVSSQDEFQFLSGFQSVLQALAQRRRPLYGLLVSRKKDTDTLVRMAGEAGIGVSFAAAEELGRLAGTGKHQGAVLKCGPLPTFQLDEILRFEPGEGRDLLVLLTGAEDPRNLGAVARCCSFLGVRALLVPSKGSAHLGPVASRASAGALESLPVAVVKGAPDACGVLAGAGYEVVGVELGGRDLSGWKPAGGKSVLVLGSEDRGLGSRVREACSSIVTIEGKGPTGSLNLSVAAGIAIYHVIRQWKTP